MIDAMDQKADPSRVLRKRIKRYGIIGGLMAGIGGLICIGFPTLVDTGLKSQMQIKEGNDITKNWENVPLAITIKVHVFNILNPRGFANGAKPKLQEMGPYYYNNKRWKEIISWGSNQETIKYWALQSFNFDADRSKAKLSDKVTVVNVPVYALAYVIKNLVDDLPLSFAIAPVAFGFANILFATHGEGFLKKLTVGELLNGYKFTILDTIDTLTKPLTWFGIQLPDNGMPGNKFGLLHVKNYTKGGPYEVYTGQGNTADKFLKFVSYQDKKFLDYYDDPKCNVMNGTDGTTAGSFLTRESTVYFFSGDSCKTFYAKYKEDSSVRGIPTYRFVLPKSLFASPDKNPDNKCYCRTPKNYKKCDGIFDLGPCQKGAPLAYSFAHFLHAGSYIRNAVEGLSPDFEKHESFLDVEPTLGAPLKVSGRLQINVLVKPMSLLVGFGGVKETVMPYVWIEESAEIDDAFERQMKLAVYPIKAIDYGSYGAVIGGLAMMVGSFGYGIFKRRILFGSKSEKEVLGREFFKTSVLKPNEPLKQNFLDYSRNNGNRETAPPNGKVNENNRTRFNPTSNQRNPSPVGINPEVMQNYLLAQQINGANNQEFQSEQSPNIYPPLYSISQQQNDGIQAQTDTKFRETDQNSNTTGVANQTNGLQRMKWSPPGALI